MLRLLPMAAAAVVICAGAVTTADAAAVSKADRYVFCTFRPQAPACEQVYREAASDPNPEAQSVKAAYEHYGRYVLSAKQGLTDKDRAFLKANGIALPPGLAESDLKGLHAVINDPKLKDADARRIETNGFLARAIEAELYCGFNACADEPNKADGTPTS